MVDLKNSYESGTKLPRIVFVHMANADRATSFFQHYWPDALAIGDPQQLLYKAFEIRLGGLRQFFKRDVWKAYWANRSFGIGWPSGNTLRDPGAILMSGKQILYSQHAEHFGTQVDISIIVSLTKEHQTLN